MKGPTLITYWDKLSPIQRRLIHDLLRAYDLKYHNLAMGLLPFVPTHAVVKLLKKGPLSPWTNFLFMEDVEEQRDRDFNWPENTRYRKSVTHDKVDYEEILLIIDPPPAPQPTKLEEQLKAWKAKGGGDAEH